MLSKTNFVVLAAAQLPARSGSMSAEIVLRKFDSGHHPFVTHQHNHEDNAYYWGHYFDNEADARADFHERCKKNGI